MLENKELKKFYMEIQEEIKTRLLSEEEGATPEQLFTETALGLLSDAGETENYMICYDEKVSKRGIEHKINAYALYENYETLDLFITVYHSQDTVQPVTKTEAEKALDRLAKFFRSASYKEYVKEIEESSQVFDLAQTLANVQAVKDFLTRVNIFLITNGEVKADLKASDKIAGYPVFFRAVDINYLFSLSEKSRVPIEIDFEASKLTIPCIDNQTENEDYQSYLAIMPGIVLADIYEQYGPRLLEQNVRSFLQFTGKINKGIRKTILEEQHMFMAFNNGIAATAEEVKIINLADNLGKAIGYVKDFQIVNGGQTTASIYHTWKKDKADITKIFVPVKLTIVKDRQNFGEVVGRIAEYANTQNKVSVSDLSSNRENHVALEKLSRAIWAPPQQGESFRTRWFYERSRGQYKNERIRFGVTPARRKQFDKQNPRSQMFTKELMAKYVNSYKEVYHGKKLVIGPHVVVKGSQKNYSQFLNYNFDDLPDSIWFEDTVALALLFTSAEKTYGVSPNAIGDMRYITVPYSIAWLGFKLDYALDLSKIWKNQQISASLREKLYEVMVQMEKFIKGNAPGSLYGEWAKKEECWSMVKAHEFNIDLGSLEMDKIGKSSSSRRRISDDELAQAEANAAIERIKNVPPRTWRKIENWGKAMNKLSQYQCTMAYTLAGRVRDDKKLTDLEIRNGIEILDSVIVQAPELFYAMDDPSAENIHDRSEGHEISMEVIQKMVAWDKKNRKLWDYEFQLMNDIVKGKKELTERNLYFAGLNLKKLQKHGFRIDGD